MAQRSGKKAPVYSADTLALRYIAGLALIALGVMMFLAVELRMGGNVFEALRQVCYGLTGGLAVALPIFPVWAGALLVYSASRRAPARPLLFAMGAFWGLSALIVLLTRTQSGEYLAYLAQSSDGSWGGVIRRGYIQGITTRMSGGAMGTVLAFPLWTLTGTVIGVIVTLILTVLSALMAFNLSPARISDLATGRATLRRQKDTENQAEAERRQIAYQQQQEAARAAWEQQQAILRQQQSARMGMNQASAQPRQAPAWGTGAMAPADGSVAEWQNDITAQTLAAGQTGPQQSQIFNPPAGETASRGSQIFGRRGENADAGRSAERRERSSGISRLFGRNRNEYDGLSEGGARREEGNGRRTASGRPIGPAETQWNAADQDEEVRQVYAEAAERNRPRPEQAAGTPAFRNISEATGMTAGDAFGTPSEETPGRASGAATGTETVGRASGGIFGAPADSEAARPSTETGARTRGGTPAAPAAPSAEPGRRPSAEPAGGTSGSSAAAASSIFSASSFGGASEAPGRRPSAEPAGGTSGSSAAAASSIFSAPPAGEASGAENPRPSAEPAARASGRVTAAPAGRASGSSSAAAPAVSVPVVQQRIGEETWRPTLNHVEPRSEDAREDAWEHVPYNYPPITDLKPPMLSQESTAEEDEARSRRLEQTLASFNVQARVVHVTHGPAISRFELELATGTKVGKVAGLEKDIAYGMEATSVRIEAPIPGKSLVGVEVPNRKVATVTLREVLESPQMQNAKSLLTVALGKDIAGTPVICDLAKMPHLLIAGATGSGKSVCVNAIINSLLYRAGPEEVRLILIDPKVVELQCYNGIPHLLIPVVNDPHKASAALAWAVAEMMERYDRFAERKVRNLDGYNASLEEGEKPMPRIVVIIDELADLMMVCKKDVEEYICRLTQLARAAGIHLIVATQRPSVEVVTGLIKANIPSRIAFKTASYIDSRTILDRNGSEQLLGYGDMLYLPTGAFSPLRVQGCFLSDEEVNRIATHVREANPSTYDPDILDKLEQLSSSGQEGPSADMIGGATETGPMDTGLFEQAVEYAIQDGQISTSTLQRRLKIGYARAGRLTDEMEERGIVSAKDGSKPRKCLITREQWEEMKKTS